MKKFIYTAIVEVEAESEDDAYMELIKLMNDHNICWDDPTIED